MNLGSLNIKVIILNLIFLNVVIGQQSIPNEKLTSIIESISKYEYGNNRKPLSDLQTAVVKSINSNENLNRLELKLINVLASDATLDGKRFICQILAKIGTVSSVDVLVSLLKENPTSNMARFALEKIDVEKVDEDLIDLLDGVNNNTKIGIINTLGIRKSKEATGKIAEYVLDKDDLLANIAATALGKIGGPESIAIIEKLMPKIDESTFISLMDSYLLIAENYIKINEKQFAEDIYSKILMNPRSTFHKAAALKGLFLSSPSSMVSKLISSLKENDKYLNQVALSHISKLESAGDHISIQKNFNSFKPEIQTQIFSIISEHELNYYLDFIRIKSLNAPVETRVNAITCIGSIGNKDDLLLLRKLLKDKNKQIKNAAQYSLYNINGDNIDNQITQLIQDSEPESQVELILAIEKRQINNANNILMKTAYSEDQKVRIASFKALTVISEPKHLNDLMQIFNSIQNKRELKVFENTLAKVSLKEMNKKLRAEIFLSSLDNIDSYEKEMSLVRILGSTGDDTAFEKISNYLESENEEIKKVAILSLRNWPNIDPIDKLIEIVKTTDNSTHKVLALRGYVNLLKNHGLSNKGKLVNFFKTAMQYAESKSDKSLVISGISTVHSLESLEYASSLLDNEESGSEAEEAVFEIVENAGWEFPEQAIIKMDKIISKPTSVESKKRAELIRQEMLSEL